MPSISSRWWITCWVGRRASGAVFMFLCNCSAAAFCICAKSGQEEVLQRGERADFCLCNWCQVWLGKEMLMTLWNHSLCSWEVCARFMHCMVTLEAPWKAQGKRLGGRKTSGSFFWRSENAFFPFSFLYGHPVECWCIELQEKGMCWVSLSEKDEALKETKCINFVLFVNLLAVFQTVLM